MAQATALGGGYTRLNISGMNIQVASAAEEQSQLASQIMDSSLQSIREESSHTINSTNKVTAASEEVNQVSVRNSNLMEKFKTA